MASSVSVSPHHPYNGHWGLVFCGPQGGPRGSGEKPAEKFVDEVNIEDEGEGDPAGLLPDKAEQTSSEDHTEDFGDKDSEHVEEEPHQKALGDDDLPEVMFLTLEAWEHKKWGVRNPELVSCILHFHFVFSLRSQLC